MLRKSDASQIILTRYRLRLRKGSVKFAKWLLGVPHLVQKTTSLSPQFDIKPKTYDVLGDNRLYWNLWVDYT